ncbi:MAG TPA: hypothetical protein VFS76_01895 [Pyrinomonadaceae bacterium]|nr:hypothetical protein [Pyrinomonadaceae bacterium]
MNYRNDARTVEAEGFRDGTQGVDPTITLKEIEAQFSQRQELEKQAAAELIKSLEAKATTLARRRDDSERHWADLEFSTEGMPPQIILPFVAIVCAVAAVIGEAVFLAPVMDGFGIAEATLQLVFAGVIVVTTSGLFEITKKNYTASAADRPSEAKTSNARRSRLGGLIFLILVTGLALTLVFILGWWRAEEMIHAATVQSGAWKEFLASNVALTRLVVVLLTTALPAFVALAFEWGLNGLHLAWEWRRARSSYIRIGRKLDSTNKALEKQLEARESRIRQIEQMREEWKQGYLQNHELGQKTSAWQTPLWRVVLKMGAVVLLVLALCVVADTIAGDLIGSIGIRALLYGCLTLGVGVLYASYAIKAWDRPTARQLYDSKATIFASRIPEQHSSFTNSRSTERSNNGTHPLGEMAQSRAQAASVR